MNDHLATAIDTRSDYFSGVDLNQRLPKILQSIQNHTGFQIEKEIWRSRYLLPHSLLQ